MAKFIIVLCAVIATASAGPGLVAPLGGVPLAYAPQLSYSSPLTYSASLAYTSPVAYGLASGGSSRVDIQNNYNIVPQYAVPFAASPFAYSAAPFAARIAAPYTAPAPLSYSVAQFAAPQLANIAAAPVAVGAPLAAAPLASAPLAKISTPVPAPLSAPQFVPAPLSYNVAQFAAPQLAKIAAAPVAIGAPLAAAPLASAPLAKIATPVPAPFAAPQFVPAPLRYSAPLLSNYNAGTAALYGSPLSYAFPGQINALPFAAPLAAAPGNPIDASIPLSGEHLSVAANRMSDVAVENPDADSEEVPAKLVSESPVPADDQKFATPAPVDGPQVARDASSVSQSPVAPVRNN